MRVAAGILGDWLPHRDLTLTAGHALLIDDVLVNAGALVNGTTIRRLTRAECGETYTVYRIETETHDLILAEGAPAETFIGNVSRQAFDNFAEYDALYGNKPEMTELPYPWPCPHGKFPSASGTSSAVLTRPEIRSVWIQIARSVVSGSRASDQAVLTV